MRKSCLPPGGKNLFQEIKEETIKAAERGIRIVKLSIGQPAGAALMPARRAAAEAVMSSKESMHEYQDNGSPFDPEFSKDFIREILNGKSLPDDVVYLPTPGTKPMLGLVILACGGNRVRVMTTTEPGYPTPKDWCDLLGAKVDEPVLDPAKKFLFDTSEIRPFTNLIMANYPHNPSGAVATRDWWVALCEYCSKFNIRLFNDAAYYSLSYGPDSCALSEVAIEFPNLSWAEAFSASKVIGNGTGWRVGVIDGSVDFIDDIKKIKGKADSGFVPFAAAGVIHALKHHRAKINEIARLYQSRVDFLVEILKDSGMQLATEPRAGFFTLWRVPKRAFGRPIQDAKDFNFAMIKNTGVVGVHFHPYIRYAVCAIDVVQFANELKVAFAKAEVSYD